MDSDGNVLQTAQPDVMRTLDIDQRHFADRHRRHGGWVQRSAAARLPGAGPADRRRRRVPPNTARRQRPGRCSRRTAGSLASRPMDDPKVVVTVFVEHGSSSRDAAPIAARIIRHIFGIPDVPTEAAAATAGRRSECRTDSCAGSATGGCVGGCKRAAGTGRANFDGCTSRAAPASPQRRSVPRRPAARRRSDPGSRRRAPRRLGSAAAAPPARQPALPAPAPRQPAPPLRYWRRRPALARLLDHRRTPLLRRRQRVGVLAPMLAPRPPAVLTPQKRPWAPKAPSARPWMLLWPPGA